MRYFDIFPIVEYSDNQATNIMVRGKIRDFIEKSSYVFYDYTVSDGERPDIISEELYGSADYTWTIFYINNIFDPIHEWVLFTDQFNSYLEEKYGGGASILTLSDTISFDNTDNTIVSIDPVEIETLSSLISESYIEIEGSDASVNDGNFFVNGIVSSSTQCKVYLTPVADIGVSFSDDITYQVANQNGALISLSYEYPSRIVKNFKNNDGLIVDKNTYLSLSESERSVESVRDWENTLNENKRIIQIVEPQYINQMVSELNVLFN